MSFEGGLIFFLAIFVFSIAPGPGTFATLARAITRGAGACLELAVGMALSDVIYLILACYGLAKIAENWGTLFSIIRIVGALYLIYLGWQMWHSSQLAVDMEQSEQPRNKMMSFVEGFLISASNPKVIVFYIAFLPTFMDLNALSPTDITVAAAITMGGVILGLMSIAVSASWARKKFESKRAMQRLNRVAASFMVSAGIYVGIRN